MLRYFTTFCIAKYACSLAVVTYKIHNIQDITIGFEEICKFFKLDFNNAFKQQATNWHYFSM